jgi:uridylate kinase
MKLMIAYADLVKKIRKQNHELLVVVGGGTLARDFIATAKQLGLNMKAQDEIAISVSRLYAQLFLEKIGKSGCKKLATTLEDASECLSKGKVVVMGGLKPGITTDAVAALVAEHVKADLVVKGTDQDGVYNKDPRKYPGAVKLDHLSYGDLTNILTESEHKAGLHQVVDPEAVKVLSRSCLRLIVVNGFYPDNIFAALKGHNVGTVIS